VAILLEDFKKALGASAQSLTEEQITDLWKKQDFLADAIFDTLLKKRHN